MKKSVLVILIIVGLFTSLFSQKATKEIEGVVTYITSQNVYVKFISAKKINPGDKIYIKDNDQLKPALVVENCSSFSCVGKPIGEIKLKIGDVLIAIVPDKEKEETKKKNAVAVSKPENKQIKDDVTVNTDVYKEQKINGKIRLASYSTLSNLSDNSNYRMRNIFSLNALNVSNSRFSLESYVSFVHKLNEWNVIQENIYNGLKIYNLNLQYELGKSTTIWAGRKINPKVSSLGAIDGLQFESNIKEFYWGAVVGFRPDYSDYSFNSKLPEYGAFVGYSAQKGNGRLLASLACVEQTNAGNIDRRFVYFQHQNSIVKNLNLFFSTELDLYNILSGQTNSKLSLTSLYVSLNYKPFKKLSVMGSYDNRKNVIYYETFKNYIDMLLEDASRQGVQLRINYRPIKCMNVSLSSSYRVRETDIRPTKNVNGFITYSQIPWIMIAATLSTNILQTSYLNGKIYGARLSKDFFEGKINTSIDYRMVNYVFENSVEPLTQHIGTIDLSYSFNRKFSLSVNYEGTFEEQNTYHRVYLNATKRF